MNNQLDKYPAHEKLREYWTNGINFGWDIDGKPYPPPKELSERIISEFQALLQRQQSDALRIEKLVGLLKDYAESGWGSEKDISKTLFKEACEALSESGVTSIDLHGEPYAINTRLKEPK